jgi:hypothetical protein
LKPNLSETEARKEAEKAAQQAKQTERINAEKTKRIS